MAEQPPDPTDLQTQIDRLRAQLDALGEEVRTRRVVVLGADGTERVVLGTGPDHGSVRVDAAGGDPSAELFAVDAIDADGPEVGIALVVDGDVVGGLRARGRDH